MLLPLALQSTIKQHGIFNLVEFFDKESLKNGLNQAKSTAIQIPLLITLNSPRTAYLCPAYEINESYRLYLSFRSHAAGHVGRAWF